MGMAIGIIISLAIFVLAPFMASKAMGLKGGVGKSALASLVSLGSVQIVMMLAQKLGPLGPILGGMGALAAWYQVVKVVYGTDTAKTFVFMFWQTFFFLLLSSLVALFFGADAAYWMLP